MTKIFLSCTISVGLAPLAKYRENSDNSTDKGGSLRSPIIHTRKWYNRWMSYAEVEFERWSGIYINSASGRTVLHFDDKSSVNVCKMGSSSLRLFLLLIVLAVTDATIARSYRDATPTGETELQ